MEVLHLSAECYPVAKTGGLGDVVGALPKYQNALGLNAMVVMPYYERKFVQTHQLEIVFSGSSKLGYRIFDFQILKEVDNTLGFELYLVKIPNLLDRPEIYCYPDESEQFIAFQLSVLQWIIESEKKVDVFHCHDHHSGLVPFLMQHSAKFNSLKDIPSIFTIHNAQYQGWLGWEKFYYLPEVDPSDGGVLEWGDCINPLASAVKCAWKFTTVSPSYLKELSINSNRLEFLFQLEGQKGLGIINGIDVAVWNPKTDPMINHNYSVTTVKSGKQKNKEELCKDFDLDPSKPLITFIGRLVGEKGADFQTLLKAHKAKSGSTETRAAEEKKEEKPADKKEDKKDGDKDKNQDKNDGNKDQDQKSQPKPQPSGISKESVQNLLDAVNNEEKKVQEKVNAQKVKAKPVQTEKDW